MFQYEKKEDDTVSMLRGLTSTTNKGASKSVTQPPWWNDEVEALWEEKRQALKQIQRNTDAERNDELKEAGKKATKAFKTVSDEAKSEL